MKSQFQFGIRTLCILMLLVICFFAGRLSLNPELEALKTEVQSLQKSQFASQASFRQLISAVKANDVLSRLSSERQRNIDRGMNLDRLERLRKLESKFSSSSGSNAG